MKKIRKQLAAAGLTGGLILGLLSGCGNAGATQSGETVTSAEVQAESSVTAPSDDSGVVPGDEEVTAELAEGGTMSITYQAEDLDADWEIDTATGIVCDDSQIQVTGDGAVVEGSTVTISKAGTYVVSGTLSDGQIMIDAGKDDVVRIVLNGAELANSRTSPVYGLQSGKIILTLAEGTENKISDAAEYIYASADEDEPNAAFFSKDDIVVNGSGTLTVDGNYECGIRSKDDLTVISGTLLITAGTDGLKGKDSVVIKNGDIQITAGKDGIKSNNDTDPEKGYIWIDGGVILIAAEDDGIQAETKVVVNGGQIAITDCQEGIAGLTVDINGGILDIVARDDGMNAAATVETEREKMMDQEGVYLRIAGGEITIDASADGLDSNGDLYIEGGTLYLSGSSGGGDGMFDYNGSSAFTGGSIFAAGSSGMMQTFGEASTQPYLVVYYESNQAAGTDLTLTDDSGQELFAFTPAKSFNAVIVSVPELEEGKLCQLTAGDMVTEVTVTGIETVSGTAQGGRGQGGFSGGRGENGSMPEGEPPVVMDGERPAGGPPDGTGMPEFNGEMTPPSGEMPDGEMSGGGRGQGGGRGRQEAVPESETAAE